MINQKWTEEEEKLVEGYFKGRSSELTLFQKIHALNPTRTYEAILRKIRRMREEGYSRPKERALSTLRVGYLDIEASDLNADRGYLLSFYIKTRGKNEFKSSLITKKEIFDGDLDKRVLTELLEALNHYDVLYTHYGVDRRYDVPFIRTRALIHKMEHLLPKYMDKFIFDTWPIARNKLKLRNNRLATIGEACGVDNVKKTPLSLKVWCKASLGDEESLKYVFLHNKRDVQLLERIHKKLEIFERPIYQSI